jgi:hypothetical protein
MSLPSSARAGSGLCRRSIALLHSRLEGPQQPTTIGFSLSLTFRLTTMALRDQGGAMWPTPTGQHPARPFDLRHRTVHVAACRHERLYKVTRSALPWPQPCSPCTTLKLSAKGCISSCTALSAAARTRLRTAMRAACFAERGCASTGFSDTADFSHSSRRVACVAPGEYWCRSLQGA